MGKMLCYDVKTKKITERTVVVDETKKPKKEEFVNLYDLKHRIENIERKLEKLIL